MPPVAGADPKIKERLEAAGQAHLLRFAEELAEDDRAALIGQIEALDLKAIPDLVDRYVRSNPHVELPDGLAPAPYFAVGGKNWERTRYAEAGETLIRAGKTAAFTVAGGQGSRLGYDGPKGCFPATPVTQKPLFAVFAEGVMATARRYGATIPWYIMTSPMNHDATVAFFRDNRYFGLDEKDVMFFPQGVMPSFGLNDGRVLLKSKAEIATSPDGHGGSFRALAQSGALEDMNRRGVKHLSYFQVDNPMPRVIDPVFIGLHAAAGVSSGEMSSKMITKTGPEEKVGNFATAGGRTMVIEYSDLPQNLAEERDDAGQLRYIAGSIAIHVIGVDLIERVSSDPKFELPYHRAEKKVAHIDIETGKEIEPDAPNAVKLERFVFDALPMCERSIVLETLREEEFGPIKNATGVDSVESSRHLQSERAGRWLEAAGVTVPRKPDGTLDCTLELSPITAMEPADLADADLPTRIDPGTTVAL